MTPTLFVAYLWATYSIARFLLLILTLLKYFPILAILLFILLPFSMVNFMNLSFYIFKIPPKLWNLVWNNVLPFYCITTTRGTCVTWPPYPIRPITSLQLWDLSLCLMNSTVTINSPLLLVHFRLLPLSQLQFLHELCFATGFCVDIPWMIFNPCKFFPLLYFSYKPSLCST